MTAPFSQHNDLAGKGKGQVSLFSLSPPSLSLLLSLFSFFSLFSFLSFFLISKKKSKTKTQKIERKRQRPNEGQDPLKTSIVSASVGKAFNSVCSRGVAYDADYSVASVGDQVFYFLFFIFYFLSLFLLFILEG